MNQVRFFLGSSLRCIMPGPVERARRIRLSTFPVARATGKVPWLIVKNTWRLLPVSLLVEIISRTCESLIHFTVLSDGTLLTRTLDDACCFAEKHDFGFRILHSFVLLSYSDPPL